MGQHSRESVRVRGQAQVRRRSRVGKALRKPLGFLPGWGVERPDAERTGSNWGRVVGDSSPSKEKEAKKSTGSLRQEELDGMQTNPSTQNINSEQSRLSVVEWSQPGAIPDGVYVLGVDGEPDGAVLTTRQGLFIAPVRAAGR